MKDIYYEKDYGRLYEKIEGGKAEFYEFTNQHGTIKHLFIKREIPIDFPGAPYFDLTTPYSYGGPILLDCEAGKEIELAHEFKAAFQHYCQNEKIVSEFVRFHPVYENASCFIDCYHMNFKRYTIQTNLSGTDDPILSEYSSSYRRDIRHALKAGVEYRVHTNPADLKDFKSLYYSTMKRNEADSIYYFDDDYFKNCIELLGDKLVVVEVRFEDKIIGMSINFAYGKAIHAHLTGTLQEYHHLAPAYVLQYALALWGKENGFDLVHHGGGRTGQQDDKLYLFKKKFGKNKEMLYFTGSKIWNEELYEALCKAVGSTVESADFPAYRHTLLPSQSAPVKVP